MSRLIWLGTVLVLMSACQRQLPIEMVAFNSLSQEKADKIPVTPKDSDVREVKVGKTLGKHLGEEWIGQSVYAVAFNHTEHESTGRLFPSVRGKFLLITSGRMIAVLTLMMHVSILGYYIPGWTSFIGSRYYELMISPWIVFFPVLFLTLLVVSLTLMTNGVRTLLDGDYERRRSSVLSGDGSHSSNKSITYES
ncbi:hypothetical protein JI667_14075 [Bacillus sp. NTK074B]|uniref:hypothetical protein n=1 Tax=Bacillus sp. NTK074B TaxID=2802174 RepID=UPI001A904B3A|nr:hypothetical protein [Bacillus sp. NTK074B]